MQTGHGIRVTGPLSKIDWGQARSKSLGVLYNDSILAVSLELADIDAKSIYII